MPLVSSFFYHPMSTATVGNKRSASTEATPEGGDHRKRRRNRTTQSCMNCHSSKRMCDRKRPCGRCTQLGLTGLCVYQVDEAGPSSSSSTEPQDEAYRLQKRVAELESLIRELKNKPHPRWARIDADSDDKPQASSPNSGSTSDADTTPERPHGTPCSEKPTSIEIPPRTPFSTCHPVFTPTIQLATPAASTPTSSPATTFQSMPGRLAESLHSNESPAGLEQSLLDSSVLNQLIEQIGYSGTSPDFGWMNEERFNGHCGCLNDSMSYGVVLELSMRLRKAAEGLQHHHNHRTGSQCMLTQRVLELDRFASNTLGNSVAPLDFHSPVPGRQNTRNNHSWPMPTHGFEMLPYPTPPCEVSQMTGQLEPGWNQFPSSSL